MKRKFIPLALTASLLFGLGVLLAMQGPDDAKFQKTLDSFLDEYWQFYPTAATRAGYHKYDSAIEDFSESTLEKRLNSLDAFNKDLVTKIMPSNLSLDNKIDREIIMNVLEYDRFNHEKLVPWEYNPLLYNEVLVHSVRSILEGNYAPLDVRAKSAYERLRQLPGFMKEAKDNLKTPAQVFTETAIAQFPGIMKFYKEDLPGLIGGVSADMRSKISGELSKVDAALEDYQKFLSNTLLPRSTGKSTLGGELKTLFNLTVQGNLQLEEDLVAQAKADVNNIRRDMALVSIPFYKIMYPDIDLDKMNRPQEEVRTIAIKGVLEKIQGEHAQASEFVETVKSTAENVKSFLEKKGLISVPSDTPAIVSMPVDRQVGNLSLLDAPGGYETGGQYKIYVQPIAETMPADRTESFLREFNNFYLPFWTAARVYPGRFLPTWLAQKNATITRKLFPNQPLLIGWSLGLGEQMVLSGFGNYDLRMRLNQLKQQLRAAVDFLAEYSIHGDFWTKDQAIAYWTRTGLLTDAEAERIYNFVLTRPGEASYAYIGMQEINALEKSYKENHKGETFNRKDFYEKLLAQGAIPPRLLKDRLQ
jgi:hypothetical protein